MSKEIINDTVKISKYTNIKYSVFQKSFFTNIPLFSKIPNKEKEKHFFILLKDLAKKDPIYINKLQEYKHYSVINDLQKRYGNHNQLPRFVFISSTSKAEKSFLKKYKRETIDFLIENLGVDNKSFERLCEKHPSDVEDALKMYKDMLGMANKR